MKDQHMNTGTRSGGFDQEIVSQMCVTAHTADSFTADTDIPQIESKVAWIVLTWIVCDYLVLWLIHFKSSYKITDM